MSDAFARLRGVFVEPPTTVVAVRAEAATARFPAWVAAPTAQTLSPAAPGGRGGHVPTVVVLCAASRSRVVAATFALALARALGTPAGIAAAVGALATDAGSLLAAPSARRAVARLRARDQEACAAGRLVWLADRRAADAEEIVARDPAAAAAAASADLGRAVAATGLPGALAVPLVRSAALDRVIGWHDGVIVIREPDAEPAVVDRVRASVAALGRPVVFASPPARHAAILAEAGLHVPAAAVQAVVQLRLGDAG